MQDVTIRIDYLKKVVEEFKQTNFQNISKLSFRICI